jgi:hypothetical protein
MALLDGEFYVNDLPTNFMNDENVSQIGREN